MVHVFQEKRFVCTQSVVRDFDPVLNACYYVVHKKSRETSKERPKRFIVKPNKIEVKKKPGTKGR